MGVAKRDSNVVVNEADTKVLDFLVKQPVAQEIGFIPIKPNRGGTSFNLGAVGDIQSPLTCVILDVEPTRTLWAMGTADVVKTIQEWSRSPLCISRSEYSHDGTLIRPGCLVGKIVKEIDEQCPEQARTLIEGAKSKMLRCKGRKGEICPWAEYGSHYIGAGQACREQRRLLVYLVNEKIVGILNVPPASLKNWSGFATSLQGRHWSVVNVDISTTPMKKEPNIEYNVLEFAFTRSNKSVVATTGEHLAPLSATTIYGGKQCMLVEAYISEFRHLEINYEDVYPDNGVEEF